MPERYEYLLCTLSAEELHHTKFCYKPVCQTTVLAMYTLVLKEYIDIYIIYVDIIIICIYLVLQYTAIHLVPSIATLCVNYLSQYCAISYTCVISKGGLRMCN